MRVIESMTKAALWDDLIIRVWRNENELRDNYDNSDIYRVLQELAPYKPKSDLIASTISNLERVSAVEILNRHGNGILIYPDWEGI
jgi:hypothetical protein